MNLKYMIRRKRERKELSNMLNTLESKLNLDSMLTDQIRFTVDIPKR